jgi:hypothetical protein
MLIGLIGIFALALISFSIGYFSSPRTPIDENDFMASFVNDEHSNLADIVQQMNTEYMRAHLKSAKLLVFI